MSGFPAVFMLAAPAQFPLWNLPEALISGILREATW